MEVSATVIVAVFTAIITYILGRRQNKLQEQQVKLQEQQTRSQEMQTRLLEYEAYKQLFSIIKDINQQSELILNRIYEHFSNSAYREMKINLIKVLYKNINDLDKRLSECSIDFELKLSRDIDDLSLYEQLIADMRMLVQMFERMEARGEIVYVEENNGSAIWLDHQGDKEAVINGIAERVIEKYKETIREYLNDFKYVRKQIVEHNTLNKIKNRITPIDA